MSEAVSRLGSAAGVDEWVYFVSFAHSGGFGNVVLRRDAPISGSADVGGMELDIVEIEKVSGVSILYFKLLPCGVGVGGQGQR